MTPSLELVGEAPPDCAGRTRDSSLWGRVDRLIDRAPRESDLRYHGLLLLAANHWRRTGRPVPASLIGAQRGWAAASLVAPLVIERTLASVQNPVVLMKGPEVARWYENPLTRAYADLDLLVEDADAAWAAMVAAGFRPTGDPDLYIGIHHLRPLVWPGLPMAVEVHHEPKWVDFAEPPVRELLATAVPSSLGLPGLLTLEPARHAVALAVHAWAHIPLGRLGPLIDVAAVSEGVDRQVLDTVASDWGVERLWRTTLAVIDALFAKRLRPPAGHLWARHLWNARERTVIERHLERWFAPFSALPPARAVRTTRSHIAQELAPAPGESRREKARRSGRAVANAFKRQSEHDEDETRATERETTR